VLSCSISGIRRHSPLLRLAEALRWTQTGLRNDAVVGLGSAAGARAEYLKKLLPFFIDREPMSHYRFIEAQREQHCVRQFCQVFGVPASCCCAWQQAQRQVVAQVPPLRKRPWSRSLWYHSDGGCCRTLFILYKIYMTALSCQE
jgi:hypothetical protein